MGPKGGHADRLHSWLLLSLLGITLSSHGQKFPEQKPTDPWIRTVDDSTGVKGSFRNITGTDYYASYFIDADSSGIAADYRCQRKIGAYHAFGFKRRDFENADVYNHGNPTGVNVIAGGKFADPARDEEVKLFRSKYNDWELKAGVVAKSGTESGGFYKAKLNPSGHMDISFSCRGWETDSDFTPNYPCGVRVTSAPSGSGGY